MYCEFSRIDSFLINIFFRSSFFSVNRISFRVLNFIFWTARLRLLIVIQFNIYYFAMALCHKAQETRNFSSHSFDSSNLCTSNQNICFQQQNLKKIHMFNSQTLLKEKISLKKSICPSDFPSKIQNPSEYQRKIEDLNLKQRSFKHKKRYSIFTQTTKYSSDLIKNNVEQECNSPYQSERKLKKQLKLKLRDCNPQIKNNKIQQFCNFFIESNTKNLTSQNRQEFSSKSFNKKTKRLNESQNRTKISISQKYQKIVNAKIGKADDQKMIEIKGKQSIWSEKQVIAHVPQLIQEKINNTSSGNLEGSSQNEIQLLKLKKFKLENVGIVQNHQQFKSQKKKYKKSFFWPLEIENTNKKSFSEIKFIHGPIQKLNSLNPQIKQIKDAVSINMSSVSDTQDQESFVLYN